MSQYFNSSVLHIARDCVGCGRLVEVMQARWGDTAACSFCGMRYEVIPVYITVRRLDGKGERTIPQALHLEPLEK